MSWASSGWARPGDQLEAATGDQLHEANATASRRAPASPAGAQLPGPASTECGGHDAPGGDLGPRLAARCRGRPGPRRR